MPDHGFDPCSPPTDGRLPVSRIQKIISSRMLQSKQEKPSYYLRINADMTLLTTTRREIDAFIENIRGRSPPRDRPQTQSKTLHQRLPH